MKLLFLAVLLASGAAHAETLNFLCEAYVQSRAPLSPPIEETDRKFPMSVTIPDQPYTVGTASMAKIRFGTYGDATVSFNPQTYSNASQSSVILEMEISGGTTAVTGTDANGAFLEVSSGAVYYSIVCRGAKP